MNESIEADGDRLSPVYAMAMSPFYIPGDEDRPALAVEHTRKYINRTQWAFTVHLRDGLVVEPQEMTRNGTFVITDLYSAPRAIMEAALNRMGGFIRDEERIPVNPKDPEEVIRRAFHNALSQNRTQSRVVVTISYRYNERQLGSAIGGLYLVDTDLMLVRKDYLGEIEHPYSRSQVNQRGLRESIPWATPDTFKLVIKAVDNRTDAKRYGDQYFMIGNGVYKVPVERDERFEDGVHVYIGENYALDSNGNTRNTRPLVHYSFDEAEALFGFKPDVKLAQMLTGEERIKLKRIEVEKEKLKIDKEKLQVDKATLEATVEKLKADVEKAYIAAEEAERKRLADREEAERKREDEDRKREDDERKRIVEWEAAQLARRDNAEIRSMQLQTHVRSHELATRKVEHEAKISPWRVAIDWFKTAAAAVGSAFGIYQAWLRFTT